MKSLIDEIREESQRHKQSLNGQKRDNLLVALLLTLGALLIAWAVFESWIVGRP